jgi:hypothetical protein
MQTRLTHRNSFWARAAALTLILMLTLMAFPTAALAAPAVDGDGVVTVSPTSVPFGSGTGTFTFTFTANNDFGAGTQVDITVPAGWTAPTTAAGAGHVSWFPGASCTLSGAPPVAVAGMDILIDIASCTAGNSFTITYANVTPGPVSLTPYTFVAQTDIGVGGQGLVPTTAPAPTVSVDPKTLTVTGITANAKVYDGATAATLNFSAAALVGVVGSDVVNLVTGGYTADFNTKHVGTAKAVTVSGLTLAGANAGNYVLTQPTSSGNITKRPIKIGAVTDTKIYDATTSSSGLPVVSGTTPLAAGDTEPTWTQTFNNKNIGAGNKVLTPAGLVNDGNGGGNYAYSYDTFSTGTINKRPITVTAETDTKTFDGNTSSGGVPILTSGSIASGDSAPTWTQTFDNRNIGINKVLTPAGVVSDGNSGNNYVYTFVTDITGVITAKTLTVSAAGLSANKIYDGATNASFVIGSPSLVGVVSPDVVTLVTSGITGAFADRNAGLAKTVTVSGLTLGGAGAGNYTLTQPTRTANITQRPVTINAATDTKTYDGTVTSSGVPTLSGSTPLAAGDSEPAWTQTFNNKNAGASKVLTPAGLVNDGNSGLNYAYTYATVSTGVISKLSITVTAVSDSKAYDGLVTSSGIPLLSGATPLIPGDTAPIWSQTFANKNVGAGKTINPAGLVNDGNGGNNYAYHFIPDVSGAITARAITVTALTHTKTYDGATSSIAPNINPALVGTDTSAFVQTFNTATVGINKTLTPSGTVNDGNSGLNYAITFAPAITTGVITARPVTITADAKSKVIGAADPALTYHVTGGSLVVGNTLTLTRAAGETAGTYAITISSFPAASNYALTFVGANLTITPIVTLYSTGAYDGWVLESTRTSNVGGSMNATLTTFQLGDDALNRQYRGILSFSTINLPDNAIVQSAVIKIKQSGIPSGTNPFSILGGLLVDIRKGAFGANALAVTDFQAAPSAAKVGTFGKTPVGGWYSVTLSASGKSNINLTGITQFRLYFTKGDNANLKADFMKFSSGSAAAASQPQLIITYTVP